MRKIIHLDMDYFFVQVEELSNPALKDKPVAIGSRNHTRGVLATSNYIARNYGVKSAMPTKMALKLCPDLVLVDAHFDEYKKYSKEVFEIFRSFSKKIQPVSIDEAYIDVTDCKKFNNDAIEIAKEIKRRIFGKTGLTASAGVSYNKLLAKIASDLNKPNGLSVIRKQNVESKIAHFPVSKIWGVGKVTQKKMEKFNIFTFADLQKFKKIDLINIFGDFGVNLYSYCRGIDEREVSENGERKSLSVEHTFQEDITDINELLEKLEYCFLEFTERNQKCSHRIVKNIHIKIKYADFTVNSVESSVFNSEIPFEDFKNLFLNKVEELADGRKPIRLLGVGVKFSTTKEAKGQIEMGI